MFKLRQILRLAQACFILLAHFSLWAQEPAPVWSVDLPNFSQQGYNAAVEVMLADFERESGRSLTPGEKQRAGIKVFTNSGKGGETPHALTRAVITALERRGFRRDQLFITDLFERNLRATGYLPPLSVGGNTFDGVPIRALEYADMQDEIWFYDSPLPSRDQQIRDEKLRELGQEVRLDPEDRKSYLPVDLINGVDFWINLPAVINNRTFGMTGALANGTVWNITNHERFLTSPANAPVAIAEIAAIPELKETWVFNITSLEYYQGAGDPFFNARYSGKDLQLLGSANAAAIDFLMMLKLNRLRADHGLPRIAPLPAFFEYADAIGLGNWQPDSYPFISLEVR